MRILYKCNEYLSRKLICLFSCFFILCLIFLPNSSLEATSVRQTKIAAVLVIDVSGSMKSTDPQRIVKEGARIFVDLLPSDGSKIAIIIFDEQIVNEFTFRDISVPQHRKDAIEFIRSIEFGDRDTDYGHALRIAYQELDKLETDEDTLPVVVFFTDGIIDLKDAYRAGRTPRSQRTAELAEELARNEVEAVLSDGRYPILPIGLYPNKNVPPQFIISDDDIKFLHRIAQETGTEEAFIARDANELRDFFINVYENISGERVHRLREIVLSGRRNIDIQKINVPSFVRSFNISIDHERRVQFTLFDPSGSEVLENDDVIFIFHDRDSSIILQNPDAGIWELQMIGPPGATVNTAYTKLYNLDIKVTIEPEKIINGRPVQIFGEFILPPDMEMNISDFSTRTDNVEAFLYINGESIGEMRFDGMKFIREHVFTENGLTFIDIVVNSEYFEREDRVGISVISVWEAYFNEIIITLLSIILFVIILRIATKKRFPRVYHKANFIVDTNNQRVGNATFTFIKNKERFEKGNLKFSNHALISRLDLEAVGKKQMKIKNPNANYSLENLRNIGITNFTIQGITNHNYHGQIINCNSEIRTTYINQNKQTITEICKIDKKINKRRV